MQEVTKNSLILKKGSPIRYHSTCYRLSLSLSLSLSLFRIPENNNKKSSNNMSSSMEETPNISQNPISLYIN